MIARVFWLRKGVCGFSITALLGPFLKAGRLHVSFPTYMCCCQYPIVAAREVKPVVVVVIRTDVLLVVVVFGGDIVVILKGGQV